MAHEDDLFLDENVETNNKDDYKITTDRDKIDARRRLEEYMEMKKLKEQIEF